MLELTVPAEPPWIKQQLRVPREDHSLFARPELVSVVGRARSNHELLNQSETDLSCRSLSRLRDWSRREVLRAARSYTERLRGEPVAECTDGLLLAGGHQPSLFHPGVWVKNFAIGALAESCGGVSLNLVVDNDTLSTTQIRVPVGTRDNPRFETEAFDADRPAQPWEEAAVLDRGLMASFAERVAQRMSGWGIEPLLTEIWPAALEMAEKTGSLRDSLTAARHRQELRWGCANLELPISRMCELDPFLWFASHLLVELPRFQQIHNEVLAEFRRVNKIRSRTHPVPELIAEEEGWLEAPFWVWREGDERRHRAFARQMGREIELSDGTATFARLPLAPGGEACCAVEALRELPSQGIRLRTRALTTTLFARLCLSDLFVHGIGGSKYDEMTDRIICRFFRIEPPSFLTLSATLNLPLAEPFAATPGGVVQLKQKLRDFRYNSDRYLSGDEGAEAGGLIAAKRALIEAQEQWEASERLPAVRRANSRSNYERFRQLRHVSEGLAEQTIEQRQQVESELADVERQLAANAILKNREFSFCLYPEEKLRGLMTGLHVEK